jgi:hypothetical protein
VFDSTGGGKHFLGQSFLQLKHREHHRTKSTYYLITVEIFISKTAKILKLSSKSESILKMGELELGVFRKWQSTCLASAGLEFKLQYHQKKRKLGKQSW